MSSIKIELLTLLDASKSSNTESSAAFACLKFSPLAHAITMFCITILSLLALSTVTEAVSPPSSSKHSPISLGPVTTVLKIFAAVPSRK